MAKCSILIYPAQSSNNNNNNTAPKTTSTTKISTFDACVPIMLSNFFLLLLGCSSSSSSSSSIYHQWFLDCNLYRKCMRSHTGSCMYGCACASVCACTGTFFCVHSRSFTHHTKEKFKCTKTECEWKKKKIKPLVLCKWFSFLILFFHAHADTRSWDQASFQYKTCRIITIFGCFFSLFETEQFSIVSSLRLNPHNTLQSH